ncbi:MULTISPECIES: hypothetical protein [Paenibacillus]|uniref:Uncharacterized protein n=1 Tax=Paenibacillus whitsoniae TaxID=2496558 RepID=A0A430J5D2_9BACL|nr:hypothetical protein [Paenibacillus whitsoniae]RTE02239.1 hypothetical protein EJQ19_29735 [Paenibacillus whitsoniae]
MEMNDSLLSTFKKYYEDYREGAGVDQSFTDAYQATAFHVIHQTEQYAQEGKLTEIQNVIREFHELGLQVGTSNDALKEQFELDLIGRILDHPGHS